MEPRISIITLGVKDLEKSYAFYHEGLGLRTPRRPDQGMIYFQTGDTCLALYPLNKLAKNVGPDFPKDRSQFPGITIVLNTKTKEDVDEILKLAEKSGGTIEKSAQDVFWGGYSGYFSDPDGYLWEVAYGAFEFNNDGSLIIK